MPDNALPGARSRISMKLASWAFWRPRSIRSGAASWRGVLCSYTPLEVIGMRPAWQAIGLCGMSDELSPDAETVLPKNLCPLIKGTHGFL